MKRLKKVTLKKIMLWSFIFFISGILATLIIDQVINRSAVGKIYSDVDAIPKNDVAIVLGTARYLTNGHENLYFTYRINAAVELYHAGKIKKILVSGDNSLASYNEPRDMFDALVEKGVAPEDIHLDYAGFRTFDSMVRAKEVFGLASFIVVSQEFHCERAIYIAKSKHMDVTGYAAKDPYMSNKTIIREYPARVNAFLDCYIIRTQPHFLGEKIDILAGI